MNKRLLTFILVSTAVIWLWTNPTLFTQPTGIPSAAISFNGVKYTFPGADGSNGDFLQTNGSGTLSWASASSAVPGDVKQADEVDYGSATGTWQPLLDVTGSGYIDQILVATTNADADVAFSGMDCDVRINIDGNGLQTLAALDMTDFSLDGVVMGYDDSDTDSYSARRIVLGARFDTSVDIDVRQTSGTSRDLYSLVHYREDQ